MKQHGREKKVENKVEVKDLNNKVKIIPRRAGANDQPLKTIEKDREDHE